MKTIKMFCPTCGDVFDGIAGAGNYPYCSSACKREATPTGNTSTRVNGQHVKAQSVPIHRVTPNANPRDNRG